MSNWHRVAILSSVILTSTVASSAQSSLQHWLNPRLGQLETSANWTSLYTFDQPVNDQPADMSIIQNNLNVFAPVRQDDHAELAAFGRVNATDLATQARLPDADVPLPDHLWDIAAGASYRWKLDNDWIAGLASSLGSPSDKPFDSLDEYNLTATGTLLIPARRNDDAWLLMLNYASNREFLPHVPIPGLAYIYSPDKDLQLTMGLPLAAARFQATPRLTLDATYFIPRTTHLQATYALFDHLKWYAAFDWQNDRYLRADRPDDDERLFYYEKKATMGLRWALSRQLALDFSGGYGFDRFFFEGENYGDRSKNRIAFSDGFFAAIQTLLRF